MSKKGGTNKIKTGKPEQTKKEQEMIRKVGMTVKQQLQQSHLAKHHCDVCKGAVTMRCAEQGHVHRCDICFEFYSRGKNCVMCEAESQAKARRDAAAAEARRKTEAKANNPVNVFLRA